MRIPLNQTPITQHIAKGTFVTENILARAHRSSPNYSKQSGKRIKAFYAESGYTLLNRQ